MGLVLMSSVQLAKSQVIRCQNVKYDRCHPFGKPVIRENGAVELCDSSGNHLMLIYENQFLELVKSERRSTLISWGTIDVNGNLQQSYDLDGLELLGPWLPGSMELTFNRLDTQGINRVIVDHKNRTATTKLTCDLDVHLPERIAKAGIYPCTLEHEKGGSKVVPLEKDRMSPFLIPRSGFVKELHQDSETNQDVLVLFTGYADLYCFFPIGTCQNADFSIGEYIEKGMELPVTWNQVTIWFVPNCVLEKEF